MVKKYRHFFFDFDGVICDSLSIAIEVFNEIRNEFFPNLPLVSSRDDMVIVYGGQLKTCLDRWIGQDGTRKFFDLHSARMQAASRELKPFDGIVHVINDMGKNNVSIVTSSYSGTVREVLEKDLSFREDSVFRIAGRELHQPKAQKIIGILRELSLKKDDAVYIGDLESDILYCRDVPMDIVSVGYGYHPPEYLKSKNPTYYVNSVSELASLLSEMRLERQLV